MNGSDRKKLIKAGFAVMRACNINKTITRLNANGAWVLVGRYVTKAALQRAVNDMREDDKTIFETD